MTLRKGFVPWKVVVHAPDGSRAAVFEHEYLKDAVSDIEQTAEVLDWDGSVWHDSEGNDR